MTEGKVKNDETTAASILWFKGYRIHNGGVWYIDNDDPDNYQEAYIGPTDDSYLEAMKSLSQRNWPKVQAWGDPHV